MRALFLLLIAGCQDEAIASRPDAAVDANLATDAVDAAIPDAQPTPQQARHADIEAFLAAEHAAHEYPGLAVGIFDETGLIDAFGFGARANDAPVDRDTVFRVGSITKPFTALTALALRDEGKLGLDDHVAMHFPELTSELEPQGVPPILVRNLLNHSSGIPRDGNETAIPGVLTDRLPTIADLIASTRGVTLDFAPGSQFSYSNMGFAIVGGIIARIDGGDYMASARRRVLDPLGMTASYWDWDEVPDASLARGHFLGPDGYEPGDESLRFGAFASEGALFSTATDMSKLGAFVLRTLAHEDAPAGPVSRATLIEATSPTIEVEPGVGIGHSFFVIDDPRLGTLIEHSGSTIDYGAEIFIAKDRGLGVIAMLGAGDGGPLSCLAYGALARFSGEMLTFGCPSVAFPGVDQALTRYRALIAETDRTEIEALFTPAFLAEVPVAEMEDILGQVRREVGTCPSHEITGSSDSLVNVARLDCTEADLRAWIYVEPEPPYRIEGLMITDPD